MSEKQSQVYGSGSGDNSADDEAQAAGQVNVDTTGDAASGGGVCRRHRHRQPAIDEEGATPHPPRLQGLRGTRYGFFPP